MLRCGGHLGSHACHCPRSAEVQVIAIQTTLQTFDQILTSQVCLMCRDELLYSAKFVGPWLA